MPGRGADGAVWDWVLALRHIAGARPYKALRFAGVGARCTLIPVAVIASERAKK